MRKQLIHIWLLFMLTTYNGHMNSRYFCADDLKTAAFVSFGKVRAFSSYHWLFSHDLHFDVVSNYP